MTEVSDVGIAVQVALAPSEGKEESVNREPCFLRANKKQSTSGNLKFVSFKRQAHLGGFFNISLLFLGVESQILVFVLIILFFCQVRFDRIELSTLILLRLTIVLQKFH